MNRAMSRQLTGENNACRQRRVATGITSDDRRMQSHERRERLLDHPGKPRLRQPPPRLGQRRHLMNDIAERRRLDEQNVRHKPGWMSPTPTRSEAVGKLATK